jgi:PAS domain S-box-containing protein
MDPDNREQFRANRLLGPGLTLGVAAVVEVVRHTWSQIDNPAALLIPAVVFSAFHGGFLGGILSAILSMAYLFYLFYLDVWFRQFTGPTINIWFATIPVVAIMVGLLKRKLERTLTLQNEDRQKAESRHRVDYARIKTMIQSAYDAFIAIDDKGVIFEWNHQAEATFGWKEDEVLGKHIVETIIPPRFREAHILGFERFFATGIGPILGKRVELPALHKSGFELPIELTISPVEVAGSFIFGAFLHDVSDRRTNEQLRALQLHITQILLGSPTVEEAGENVMRIIGESLQFEYGELWQWDEPKLQIVCTWNIDEPALIKFGEMSKQFAFGPKEGLPGRIFETKSPQWYVDFGDGNFERASLATEAGLHGAFGFPVTVQEEIVGVICMYSLKPKRAEEILLQMMPEIGARFGIFVQRARAEQKLKSLYLDLERRIQERTDELQRAKEAAEEANIAKTSFLANMSHEIRTPLGAVLGFAELIAEDELTGDLRHTYTETIRRNGELLSNIISDILDLSKVDAGKLEIETRDSSLSEILKDVTTVLNLKAVEKGLRLSVKFEGKVPTTLRTDPLRLRQILINVIGNAIKFTERGGVTVIVKAPEDLSPLLAFEIKDTGPGIEADQTSKLFQPFSQADNTTKRQHGGTGLGLILSKRLAQLLGGDVTLKETQVGVGSTFLIKIRPGKIELGQFTEGPVAETPTNDFARTADPRLDGLKVLLVEDADDNQTLISHFLEQAGASVDIAENGQVGVERAISKTYDVLLMDLQMPVMDGYEATTSLREKGLTLPIIALTAHAMKEERERCLRSGFNDHLVKPVSRHNLLESIAKHTGKL